MDETVEVTDKAYCRHCQRAIKRVVFGSGGACWVHESTNLWFCQTTGADPAPDVAGPPAAGEGWIPGCPDCRGHTLNARQPV
jgi:hypothetical protein